MEWAGPIGLVIHHSLLLFAVVNPIGNIPVYADLTRDLQQRERKRVMNLAVITAVVTFFFVFLIARNVHLLMRLAGPYAGMMIARLLYIFLAAKAVAMILHGVGGFLGQFFPRLQPLP